LTPTHNSETRKLTRTVTLPSRPASAYEQAISNRGAASHQRRGRPSDAPPPRTRWSAQITALHGLLLAADRDRAPGRRWVAAGWMLSILHLGLLEHRDRLSPADALTLIRGNLPATATGSCRWSGVAAIGLNLAEGRLARRQATVSPFGDYADSIADAAF
jgi:hypothetical protein